MAAYDDQAFALQLGDQGAIAATRGGGSSGGGGTVTATSAGPTAYEQWLMDRQTASDAASQREVLTTVSGLFDSFGLSSLYPKIVEYAQMGYSPDSITILLRSTPEYAARFPAMAALNKKGHAMSEAAYVAYEKNAAGLESRFGLPKGMLAGQITNLLTNEVSSDELQDRVTLAAADSITAPDDLKAQLKNYFGIDPSTALTAYYLDPTIAVPLLEKQSAEARIGVQATRQGIDDFGLDEAEQLRAKGVTESVAGQGFEQVKADQSLSTGKGETVSRRDITSGVFGDADAAAATARVAGSRVAGFKGGGGFADGKQGAGGIGSANT